MNLPRRTLVAYCAVAVLVALAAWFVIARPIAPRPVASAPSAQSTLPASLDGATGTATKRPFPGLTCRPGAPRRLVIPALSVSAAFERIGLDRSAPADSAGRHPLGNPRDRTKAGWYADGPRPGSGTGTVLTNGHTYRDNSAIFKENFAERVNPGQLIHVEMANGSTCSYRVSRVWRDVDAKTEYPRIVTSQHLYDFTGPERLFLTTCGGSWNSLSQNYDQISLLIATPVNRG